MLLEILNALAYGAPYVSDLIVCAAKHLLKSMANFLFDLVKAGQGFYVYYWSQGQSSVVRDSSWLPSSLQSCELHVDLFSICFLYLQSPGSGAANLHIFILDQGSGGKWMNPPSETDFFLQRYNLKRKAGIKEGAAYCKPLMQENLENQHWRNSLTQMSQH